MAFMIEDDVLTKYIPENDVDTLVIPDTVKEIAENAFYQCNNIKEVVIYGNDLIIHQGAFAYFTSLRRVTFYGTIRAIRGKSDFQTAESAMAPFEGCSALESVNFEGNIGSMGGTVFTQCENLRRLVISGEIDYLGGTFVSETYDGFNGSFLGCVESCDHLEEIILAGTIKTIDHCAFKQCKSLKKICITGNVGEIGGTILTRDEFWGYTIDEPFPAVRHCGESDDAALLHLEISGNVETIRPQAFAFCSGLKSVVISGNVKRIDHNAFERCSNLETVIISGTIGDMGQGVFKDCENLEKLEITGTVNQ